MSRIRSSLRRFLPKRTVNGATFDVQSVFRPKLVDLGTMDAALAGIYAPETEIGQTKIGVTAQFLEDAETYHQKYASMEYFRPLVADALRDVGPIRPGAIVLDVGSGSGNSVLPCLELLPECRVVATDLSESLLAILRRHIGAQPAFAGRMIPVCTDATRRDTFRPGAFDLVLGAAILHHLIDPAAAIRAASVALVRGGNAVFFEPFESGNAILRIAYSEILARDEGTDRLAPNVTALLRALIRDLEVRTGTDKSDPIFRRLDDKWLFTRTYLEALAEKAGFRELVIRPIHDLTSPFSTQTEVYLRLGAGLARDALPASAWETLARCDGVFSAELKPEMLLEGCIVMKR